MTTITTEEVRTNLPDLLRRIADGEELVIIEGGKWVGLRAPPTASAADGSGNCCLTGESKRCDQAIGAHVDR